MPNLNQLIMSYIKKFSFDDIEEGCKIRDTIDNEVQTVGKHIEGRGWQVFPERSNTEAHGVVLYVPDNLWPGRYELIIED